MYELKYDKQTETEDESRFKNLKKRHFFCYYRNLIYIRKTQIENRRHSESEDTTDVCFINSIQVTDEHLQPNCKNIENVYCCFKDNQMPVSKNKQEMSSMTLYSSNSADLFNNSDLYSFIKEIIDIRLNDNGLVNCSLLETSVHDLKIDYQPNAYSIDEISNSNAYSIDEISNSNVYSIDEMKTHLNLKTISFNEMPHNPVKVGEASFSEVFKVDGLIYKIIPFNEWYSLESFYREAFILDLLKDQPGISKLIDKFLVTDGYSEEYLRAWDNFIGGENSRPSEKHQMYGVLVMNDCGVDLEKYNFETCEEIVYFFDQILSILTLLEDKFKFEHRDMHWGNIMINGSRVYLIDLNFARLEKEKVVYTDLDKEEWLFDGDQNVDIQFGVYVKMKKCCESNWDLFNACTNFLWIKYLLNKMKLKIELLKSNKDKISSKRVIRKMITKAEKTNTCKDFKKWFDDEIMRHVSLN